MDCVLRRDLADRLVRLEGWFEAQPDLDPERLIFIDDSKGGEAKLARPPPSDGVMLFLV